MYGFRVHGMAYARAASLGKASGLEVQSHGCCGSSPTMKAEASLLLAAHCAGGRPRSTVPHICITP